MAEFITLIGAEDVTRAASSMRSSAEDMLRAANIISESNDQFMRRYEELISREMRVREVTQEIDGVHHALPITHAHSTADGVVIVVGGKHG